MGKNTELLDSLYQHMITYYSGDPKRIQHFVKVHGFPRLIGHMEAIPDETLLILEAAAYVHDIGIKPAERLYGSCSGNYQEELGPAPAADMLKQCGFSAGQIERITYLVGHHHTYNNIDGLDYQILVEADFLVNFYEDATGTDAIRHACETVFKTVSGREICRTMFDL